MHLLKLLLILVVINFSVGQKDPNHWQSRNTIVHLFEWKWVDIAKECETFLSVKGFAGVQVSPPNENIIVEDRPWWERYQPISYKIISRSGTEAEFSDMVARCNKVGIRIYVDAIINHMARNASNPIGVGGSKAMPSNKYFPAVPYNASHFHTTCQINDYANKVNVRNCELEGLKDLDQQNIYVRDRIINYLNHLISLGVAGFRIDASKHMSPNDLKMIYSNLCSLNASFGFPAGAKSFLYQEVIDLGGEAISSAEYTPFGTVTEFKYGMELGRVFRGYDKLAALHNWGFGWGLIPNSGDAFVFIDNHDNQRGHGAGGPNILTHKNPREYIMATAFMLAYPYGITRVMSSYNFENRDEGPPSDKNEQILSPEFHGKCKNGWICEHRWRQIYNMIAFKEAVKSTTITKWWSNGKQQIAFCRGNKGFIAFTNGGNISSNMETCLPPGQYCDIISGSLVNRKCTGKVVHVNNTGSGHINLNEDEHDGVLAIHVNAEQY